VAIVALKGHKTTAQIAQHVRRSPDASVLYHSVPRDRAAAQSAKVSALAGCVEAHGPPASVGRR
jgi:hypothetical protein